MNPTPVPGMTCKTSKAKTAVLWEIQTVNPASRTVYLSKLGGDGFVNKTASWDDLIDVQTTKLSTPLHKVLGLRDRVRNMAAQVRDSGRFITRSEAIAQQAEKLYYVADELHAATQEYYRGINQHYPHLTQEDTPK